MNKMAKRDAKIAKRDKASKSVGVESGGGDSGDLAADDSLTAGPFLSTATDPLGGDDGGRDPVAGDSGPGPAARGDETAAAGESTADASHTRTKSMLSDKFVRSDSYDSAVHLFALDGVDDREKELAVMRAVIDVIDPPSTNKAKKTLDAFRAALHESANKTREDGVKKTLKPFVDKYNSSEGTKGTWDEMLAEAKARIEEAARKMKVVGQWSRVRRRPVTGSGSSPRRLAPVRRRPVAAVRSTAVSKARRAPVKRKRSSVAAASSSAKSARRPGK
eukprot:jgi/Mesvir1/1323/Mv04920-RA.1